MDPAASQQPRSVGQCLCRALTVTVSGHDFSDGQARGHLCHCYTCRRSTGTDYAHNFRLPEAQLSIVPTYRLSEYRGVSAAGSPFVRTFCSVCGSTITSKSLTPEFAGVVVVRLGLFPTVPPPAGEMCADEKLRWLRDRITNF